VRGHAARDNVRQTKNDGSAEARVGHIARGVSGRRIFALDFSYLTVKTSSLRKCQPSGFAPVFVLSA